LVGSVVAHAGNSWGERLILDEFTGLSANKAEQLINMLDGAFLRQRIFTATKEH
jgi:hypothetical protein